MKSILLSSIAVCACVIVSRNALAQTNDSQSMLGQSQTNDVQGQVGLSATNDVQGQLSARDFKFAKAAAQGGKMEVTLGQLATQNAQDPNVRDFGSKMVQDHQAANQQLEQLLVQKGASVSGAPSWFDQRMINHLQGLKGDDFDKSYIKHMVSDHKADIKEFQKEAENGDDADIKNFASKTLPTLQEHLRMAEDAQAKLSSSAAK